MARRSTSKALALLPALGLAATAAACAQPVPGSGPSQPGEQVKLVKPGALTVCTHLPYPPFQLSQGDKTVGFDVDLVDLVARDLGVKQDIVDTPFEGIQSGQAFNEGKCDLGAAAMSITPERRNAMDFSEPYFDAKQALLVRKGSGIDSLDKLRGKKLGTQQATTGEEYAQANKDKYGYEVVQFEDLALEQNAVKSGQIAAGINDNGVHYDFVKSNPDVETTVEFDTGDRYGIGMRKQNRAMKAKVDAAIARAKADGTYDKIYEKWFGRKPASK